MKEKTPNRKEEFTQSTHNSRTKIAAAPESAQVVRITRVNQTAWANRISLVLNAPVVASVTFLILTLAHRTVSTWLQTTTAIFFGTLLPLTILYCLSKGKIIPDFFASERDSRAKPFIGAMASYVLGTLVLLLCKAAPIVTVCMFCYFGNSMVMTLISLKWKISIHTSGISGPGVVLMYSFGAPWFLFMLLLLPVGWARIKLEAHTPTQVLAGVLVTAAITWIQLQIILTHVL